jgi:hypothetical protein
LSFQASNFCGLSAIDSGMGTFRPWRKQSSRALIAWAA